jgi:Domain of unknown function (DUF4129)
MALLFGGLLLAQSAAGAEPPPAGELAREILADPAYQRELPAQPEPRQPESGCDRSARIHVGGGGSSAGAAGSVVSLLAWLAVGVAVALVALWVGAAVVRRRRETEADARAVLDVDGADPGLDPSLAAVQRLAAQGQYPQAIHELLLLTVQRLADRHSRTVSGWLTSRELIRLLPATDEERQRFSRLVTWVERALFGGQAVDRNTFDDCLADFMALGLA